MWDQEDAHDDPPVDSGRIRVTLHESRPRPRRAPLTRTEIVRAALEVVDSRGFDALSMRTVAGHLDAGVSSIYNHVSGRNDLLDLMLDHVIGEVVLPEPQPDVWPEQLKGLARGIRDVFRAHRDMDRVAAGRFPLGLNGLRFIEATLAVARAGGVDDRTAAHLTYLLPQYGQSIAADDHPDTVSPEQAAPESVRRVLDSLPVERFPLLRAAAPLLADGSVDDRFEFGLSLLVDGLAQRVGLES